MIGFALGAIFWIATLGSIANKDPAFTEAGIIPWLMLAVITVVGGAILAIFLPTTISGMAIASTLGSIAGIVVAIVTGQPGMILPMLIMTIACGLLAIGAQTILSGRIRP